MVAPAHRAATRSRAHPLDDGQPRPNEIQLLFVCDDPVARQLRRRPQPCRRRRVHLVQVAQHGLTVHHGHQLVVVAVQVHGRLAALAVRVLQHLDRPGAARAARRCDLAQRVGMAPPGGGRGRGSPQGVLRPPWHLVRSTACSWLPPRAPGLAGRPVHACWPQQVLAMVSTGVSGHHDIAAGP